MDRGRLATLLEGAGCLFFSKIDQIFSKINYGDIQAVKLDYELIKVQRSVPTIDLCKKNEYIHWAVAGKVL